MGTRYDQGTQEYLGPNILLYAVTSPSNHITHTHARIYKATLGVYQLSIKPKQALCINFAEKVTHNNNCRVYVLLLLKTLQRKINSTFSIQRLNLCHVMTVGLSVSHSVSRSVKEEKKEGSLV